MIEPKEIEIDGKTFVISKYPATEGREIVAKYPSENMPKLGSYQVSHEIMLKNISHAALKDSDGTLRPLKTKALIDNHVGSWETLVKLEWAILEYNISFFQNGRALNFLEGIVQKLPALTSKILMGLSEQLLQKGEPPSTN